MKKERIDSVFKKEEKEGKGEDEDKKDPFTFQTLLEGFPELVRIIVLFSPDGRSFLSFLLTCKRVKESVTQQDLLKAPDMFAVENNTLQIYQKVLPNRWQHGPFREYFVMKGKRVGLKARGVYRMGKRNGVWEEWSGSGKILVSTHYVNGVEEGERKVWDTDRVCYVGRVKNGKKVGKWLGYYSDGSVAEEGSFEEKEEPFESQQPSNQNTPAYRPTRWLEYKGLWGRERKVGVWTRYHEDGRVQKMVDFG